MSFDAGLFTAMQGGKNAVFWRDLKHSWNICNIAFMLSLSKRVGQHRCLFDAGLFTAMLAGKDQVFHFLDCENLFHVTGNTPKNVKKHNSSRRIRHFAT